MTNYCLKYLLKLHQLLNALLKRNVFNLDLKLLTELDSLISLGKLFHSLGAANINARSPSVTLDLKLG